MHFSMNEELIKSDNSKYFRVKVDMRQTDLKNIYLESENSTVLKEKENINGNESETVFGNNFPIIDVNFIPKNNTLNLENTQISSISFKAEFQIEEVILI